MRLRRFLPQFLLILCLICFASSALGQTESATLSGLITDPLGKPLSGVEVQITNQDTNVSVQRTTNDAGLYVAVGLKPGRYRVSVTKEGFRTVDLTDLVLNVQDVLSRNFQLQLGPVSTSITVVAEENKINTRDASVSTVIDRTFVANTPLNGRSFQDLISMTPGVVTQNPNTGIATGQAGDFSVNGQRTESNYYTVDGVSANVGAGAAGGSFIGANAGASGSLPASTVLGTTQSLVSVDALQEFRVQSSTYSAEYGRAPGGQFSLVTRSGTNDLHGTLFDYVRNDRFDANDWFNSRLGLPKSPLRQNDFGGTFGGPIRKDQTFFFVSYEGLRLTQPQATVIQLVPDMFMRQQAPAALQPILNAFPVPNGKDFGSAASPSLAQFIQPFSSTSNVNSTSIRVDQTFGSKLSSFFRFADTPSSALTRGFSGSASALTTTGFNTQTYTLGAVSQLSSTASDDFRVGYATSKTKAASTLDSFGGASPIDFASAMGASGPGGRFLTMAIIVPGAGLSLLRTDNAGNQFRQWNLLDTFSVSLGRHQLKTGVDYRRIVSPNTPALTIFALYRGAQSVLNNKALLVGVTNPSRATPIFNEASVFAQDAWSVTSNLNVSLGVRWEVDPPPHGANGNDAYTLVGSVSDPSSLALAPRGTPLWHTTRHNFAPRLGVAWIVRDNPGSETVVRAGGGVFFDTNNQTAAEGFSGLGFVGEATYFGASLPLTPDQLNISPSVTPPFSANVYLFPRHLQLPYTSQWSVGVQQAIGAKQTLSLTYVGSAARRLTGLQSLSMNGLSPLFGPGSRLTYWTSNLSSDYNALQVQFQRSVSQGIHALASYTWSHCLDVASSYSSFSTAPGVNQTAFVRGNCDMDVRHNFAGGVSWDLPGVSSKKLVQSLANGWGLDVRLIARSGFPIFLCGDQPIDPVTGSQYCAGLDLVPNQPLYVHGSQYSGGRAINPAAFSAPAGTVGNAPRNFVRGFGTYQFNVAIRREFTTFQRVRLQLRVEAFNVFNHPNFGAVDSDLNSPTFGQAIAMLNQSLPTVASQYQQGGPRSMQFSMRFIF